MELLLRTDERVDFTYKPSRGIIAIEIVIINPLTDYKIIQVIAEFDALIIVCEKEGVEIINKIVLSLDEQLINRILVNEIDKCL